MILRHKNFVDLENKEVHTQGVDGLASHLKAEFRKKRGMPKHMVQGYLNQLALNNLAKRKGNLKFYFIYLF